MNETQAQLLELSRRIDISQHSLRELAVMVGARNPQTVKHHLQKLSEAGLLRDHGAQMRRVDKHVLGGSELISIPILGAASAGPATQLAGSKVQGYLRVSSRLLDTRNYKKLYALRVAGTSMNKANIKGKTAENGDFVIVDSSLRAPKENDHVIAVVDDLANIKRFHFDAMNEQIVLLSDSTEDYMPIFVHQDDDREGLISGTVVQVIKTPSLKSNVV
jgi:SOS-response transcriptional repressor LexA